MSKNYTMGVIGVGMGVNMLPVNGHDEIPIKVTQICGGHKTHILKKLKSEYNLEQCTTDYMELIEDPGLDIIAVFSPDALHYEHCKAALLAGKHVLCTKPMVVSLEEAKEIVELVDKTGVKFMVGQTMRYEPQFSRLREHFDNRAMGDVFMGEAHYIHDMRSVYKATPWRIQMPQDMIYGGLSHPIDALRWFFGDVEEVHAVGCKTDMLRCPVTGKVYEDCSNYMVNLKFKSGHIARALGAYGVIEPPQPMMGINLYGTKGTAIAEFSDFLGGKVTTVLESNGKKTPNINIFPPETEGAFGHGRTSIRYLIDFANALVNDNTPQPSVREGAKTVASCQAAYESIQTGKVVKVFNEF